MEAVKIFSWIALIIGLFVILISPELGPFTLTLIILIYLKMKFKELSKGTG